jgi:DNA polymerase-1
MDKKLFLIDAYALIYRSYYGFIRNPRINSKGLNTSAIFGFVNSLQEVLRKEKPSHIAVAFDPAGPTFRHEMFKAYKANRDATPEDIKLSVPYIKKILNAYQIPIIEEYGYEADDVIGTVSCIAAKEGFDVYMMTPDKDFLQLVNEKVFMYRPRRSGESENKIFKIPDVLEKYQIKDPKQVIDILALWGDSADNVPGAPGVGEKTAIKLVDKYGSVEKMLENTADLKGKQKEKIEANVEQIKLSKVLVTIKLDVPVKIDFDSMVISDIIEADVRPIFEELEFGGFINRMFGKPVKAVQVPQGSLFPIEVVDSEIDNEIVNKKSFKTEKPEYILVDTPYLRNEIINHLSKQSSFTFDTETTNVSPHKASLLGMSFCTETKKAYYVLLPQDEDQKREIVHEFKSVFEDESIQKCGQNIKYDMLMLLYYGVQLKGPIFDTMVAHYILHTELRHNMDFMANTLLNYETIHIESLIGKKGKLQKSMADVDIDLLKDYAAEDADITFQLKEYLEIELKEENADQLYYNIEAPLIPVLTSMEYTGIYLEASQLDKYAEELSEELSKIEQKIYDLTEVEFNIGSPKQLGEILFDRLKITDKPVKTKTKQYSTSEETLQKLIDTHPVIPEILEYRSVKKLLSTYVLALPKLINPKTGRIHASFNQAITTTGRLSSNNPNLQNIPIRDERGQKIREAFTAKNENFVFLSADYSQIELRLMAHMSKDENMIKAFNTGKADIHSETAAKVFHVAIEDVTREQRSKAKTANFGIIYGISPFGLSQRLRIPRSEAKELIDGYFESFPRVKEYMAECIASAREKEYVETIMGRRRYLSDINSRNGIVRGMAERNAINAPIQGSAADIIKIAMINIYNRIREEGLNSRMNLQVHDELNFECPIEEKEKLAEIVRYEMENAVHLSVPLTVDLGVGKNWMEAH